MTFVATIIGLVITFVLGFAVLPALTSPLAWGFVAVFRKQRKFAYFVGRYLIVGISATIFYIAVAWMTHQWSMVAWPIWVLFTLLLLLDSNTLISYDVDTYRSRSGIWADYFAHQDPVSTENVDGDGATRQGGPGDG